jgi:hypothetical protein
VVALVNHLYFGLPLLAYYSYREILIAPMFFFASLIKSLDSYKVHLSWKKNHLFLVLFAMGDARRRSVDSVRKIGCQRTIRWQGMGPYVRWMVWLKKRRFHRAAGTTNEPTRE